MFSKAVKLAFALVASLYFLSNSIVQAQELGESGGDSTILASAYINYGVTIRSKTASDGPQVDVSAPDDAAYQITRRQADVENLSGRIEKRRRIVAEFE